MRTLLVLLVILFQGTANNFVAAASFSAVKSIDTQVKDHELAISFFQLSFGEATLIQGPHHQNVLVVPGERVSLREVKKWLSLFGIKDINQMVITAGPEINIGLIKELIRTYRIKCVTASTSTKDWLVENLDIANQIVIKSWEEGTKDLILPEAMAEAQHIGREKNDGIDFTIQFFEHRIFFMTSASQNAEKKLLAEKLGKIHIFKVPNYTKEDPFSEKLIKKVSPQLSVFFSDLRHADSDIIDYLLQTWSQVYFTQKHGTITIKLTKTDYEVFIFPMVTKE